MLGNLANSEVKCIGQPTAAISATAAMTQPAVVDITGYTGLASFMLNSGGIDDTDTSAVPTMTFKIQSAIDTAFTAALDVTGGGFTAISAATASAQALNIDLQAITGPYVRAYVTVAGTGSTPIGFGSVTGLFQKKGY